MQPKPAALFPKGVYLCVGVCGYVSVVAKCHVSTAQFGLEWLPWQKLAAANQLNSQNKMANLTIYASVFREIFLLFFFCCLMVNVFICI